MVHKITERGAFELITVRLSTRSIKLLLRVYDKRTNKLSNNIQRNEKIIKGTKQLNKHCLILGIQLEPQSWTKLLRNVLSIYKFHRYSNTPTTQPPPQGVREFKKLLRGRQRERHKRIGFNEKNKGHERAF